ncbi:unnamed protein product [Rotaria sp. Silwood1]|nr:unnamed protein product [Rotaria sp. Silwood1]
MLISPTVVILVFIFAVADSQVLLYNTENKELAEEFDCVYYIPYYGEEILYCRRLSENQLFLEQKDECSNQGEKQMFGDLLKKEIHPSIVFKWSSSVEMTDSYSKVFNNRSLIDDNENQFVCKCTPGTFGKYCEYQLTHESKKFSEAVKRQFEQKQDTDDDSWNTQRYGKILCYETLPCSSSSLCLDCREICDGIQRCSNGVDEENCDKLEFNECDDDEFRCENGMCISQEFWLDGE